MTLLFDCETNGLLDKLDRIHCIIIKDTEDGTVSRYVGGSADGVESGARRLMAASEIVGHNSLGFDVKAIRKVFPWFQPQGRVLDTLVLTRLIWPNVKELDYEKYLDKSKAKGQQFPKELMKPFSLKAWGFRLGVLKGNYGETSDWSVCTPEMVDYCAQDVEVTHALWDRIKKENYSERAIAIEHDFAALMIAQEDHGFRFDTKAAVDLYGTLSQRRTDLERELKAVCPGWFVEMKIPEYWTGAKGDDVFQFPTKGECQKAKLKLIHAGPMKRKPIPFNPSSRDHISRFLQEKYGWKPLLFGKDGKPTCDEEVLAPLPYPEIPLILDYMTVEKRIGSVAEGKEAWLKAERNGRIHGRVNHNGTISSRCTFSQPNMGQITSVDKPYGKECRALFIANEGHVLVGADASGIQLRALAHYMHPFDGGAYVEAVLKGDIHTTNQKAAGLDTRDKAKTYIYAWVLGAGPEKAGEIAGVTPQEVMDFKEQRSWEATLQFYMRRYKRRPTDEELAKFIKGDRLNARFAKNLPALIRLKEAVQSRVESCGYLKGLDGRRLPLRSAHTALSSLLQGFEAVVMKRATSIYTNHLLSKGHRYGVSFGQAAMVYDEWQVSSKKDIADEVGQACVQAIKQAGEEFGSKCPLTGEYRIGANWADTH